MEFNFTINNLFGAEITRLDNHLMPHRTTPSNIREYKNQLCRVIDKMGEASGKAQGLHSAVTSSTRMTLSDHIIYIMKDAEANSGKGSVVGFLKVGWKKLFIFDPEGKQIETEPMCALDFYVHESRQRMGCGRKLFDFMLQAENMDAHQIAIDRPSHKFLSFLAKHYGLKASVKQVNNFVVFDRYFKAGRGGHRSRGDGHKPPQHPYRRTGNVSQASQVTESRPRSTRLASLPSTPKPPQSPSSALQQQLSSEHQSLCDRVTSAICLNQSDLFSPAKSPQSPPNPQLDTGSDCDATVKDQHNVLTEKEDGVTTETEATRNKPGLYDDDVTKLQSNNSKSREDLKLNLDFLSSPESSVDEEASGLMLMGAAASSPGAMSAVETANNDRQNKEALRDVVIERPTSWDKTSVRPTSISSHNKLSLVSVLDESERRLQNSLYSRHVNRMPDAEDLLPGNQQSNLHSNKQSNHQSDPHSNHQNGRCSPPSISRNGPSRDYLNLNRNLESRRGTGPHGNLHSAECSGSGQNAFNSLKSNSSTSLANGSLHSPSLPPADPYTSHSAKPRGNSSAWNIFGVPTPSARTSNTPDTNSASQKKYQLQRLW